MSMRDKIRERNDQRLFGMETLKAVTEWISQTNPIDMFAISVKGKENIITDDELKQRMRDWIEKSGDLITKCWSLPDLMVEDAIKVMTEVTGLAITKETSASK